MLVRALSSAVVFLGMMAGGEPATHLTFSRYRVLYDASRFGLRANSGYAELTQGVLELVFTGALGDDEAGMRPLLARSSNWGQTWSDPRPFGPASVLGRGVAGQNSALWLTLFGPTAKGTVLSVGYYVGRGVNRARAAEDLRWRESSVILGRREKTTSVFKYTEYAPETFLAEQFAGPGIIRGSRVVLQIWGAAARGENWQCGTLLSDDDGRTWRYRQVAYEPSLDIRDNPAMPAGFNEQTLFLTGRGALVSIIRGREKLGRVADSPRDTWFFRSVSRDGGETWSKPSPTNLAGTGAPATGLTLPDGTLLIAARVPYSRDLSRPVDRTLFGLQFARSTDEGRTWHMEYVLQHDPEGSPFDDYYSAMNGEFIDAGNHEWVYIFGQFSVRHNRHRILAVTLHAN